MLTYSLHSKSSEPLSRAPLNIGHLGFCGVGLDVWKACSAHGHSHVQHPEYPTKTMAHSSLNLKP